LKKLEIEPYNSPAALRQSIQEAFMDLTVLSHSELQKLKTKIEKEIESRNKKQRSQAMDEIKSIVSKYGLKLDEVIGNAAVRKPRNGAAKAANKSERTPAVIIFRHPENPALTWSGGRGRRPQWIKEWEASGRSLDEARITGG
jgi:DNA-binding protein H-NS